MKTLSLPLALVLALFCSVPYSTAQESAYSLISDSRPVVAKTGLQKADANLSGEELFNSLHDYTSRHKAVGYGTAQRLIPTEVDGVVKDGRHGVICQYSEVFVECSGSKCTERGDQNGDGKSGDFINIEHTWPQSFFDKSEPMRSDMHQLLPTLSVPNAQRGNMPFNVVPQESMSDVTYQTGSGSRKTDSYFEPNDASKGNVARALFYFAVTYTGNSVHHGAYGNNFWDSKVDMLLEWNRQDPPDEAERHRNDVIAKYQGARNPFIDDPSLADKIGAQVWKKMH